MRATIVYQGVPHDVDVFESEPNPDGPTDFKPVVPGYTLEPAYMNNFLVWIATPE
jgi:hypothetical protein